jgi:hypothetical protein
MVRRSERGKRLVPEGFEAHVGGKILQRGGIFR